LGLNLAEVFDGDGTGMKEIGGSYVGGGYLTVSQLY